MPTLAVHEVCVDFPGMRALDHVSLEINESDVVAVVGANGSGKTTLLSVLCGLRSPTTGNVADEHGPVRFRHPRNALDAGICLVPQEPQLALSLACWENVCLGRRRLWQRAPSRKERAAAIDAVREALPHVDPRVPAAVLRKGDRAVLGLLAALERRPRILALDEPTAVLGERSVEIVSRAVETVRSSGGAVVLVSHRLRDIVQLATRLVVLVDGRLVFDDDITTLTLDQIVDRMAHGRGTVPVAGDAELHRDLVEDSVPGRVVLAARGIATRDGLEIGHLDVRGGEIVGLAGLGGSGRSRLLRLLAGSGRPVSGERHVDGRPYGRNEHWARRAGIAYVPEDRAREGVFPSLSVSDNLTIQTVAARRLLGPASPGRETACARGLIERFRIRTTSSTALITSLSGGNQQRVVLARALAQSPLALVADEPTQGVDREGRAAIHEMLRTFARQGGAVLVASSEFEELQEICTRILVIRDGRLVAEFPGADVDYRTLVSLATGATESQLPAEVPA